MCKYFVTCDGNKYVTGFEQRVSCKVKIHWHETKALFPDTKKTNYEHGVTKKKH